MRCARPATRSSSAPAPFAAESYGPLDQLAVVVSRSLDLPPTLGLLRAAGNRVVVITDGDGELEPCAATVDYLRMPVVDLRQALRAAARPTTASRRSSAKAARTSTPSCSPAGLVDELHLVLSPLLVGGRDPLTLVAGAGARAATARPSWLAARVGRLPVHALPAVKRRHRDLGLGEDQRLARRARRA